MSFIKTYKYIYLAGLLINLAFLIREKTFVQSSQYAIDAGTFAVNLAAWLALRRSQRWALSAERALSIGRMLVPIMASTIFLLGLVAYSPLAIVLWKPVLTLTTAAGLPALWACCLILLCLEVAYLTQLRAPA